MNKISVGILAFVVAIIGVIFLMTISQTVSDQASTSAVVDDTFSAVNNTCVSVTNGCIISLTSVKNATSGTTINAARYGLCNTHTVKPFYDGVQVLPGGDLSTGTGVNLNATYTESGNCSYNPDGTSKNLTVLIGVFFALALIGAAIYYFKETGILDGFGK